MLEYQHDDSDTYDAVCLFVQMIMIHSTARPRCDQWDNVLIKTWQINVVSCWTFNSVVVCMLEIFCCIFVRLI